MCSPTRNSGHLSQVILAVFPFRIESVLLILFLVSVRVRGSSRYFTLARVPVGPKSGIFSRMKMTIPTTERLPAFSCCYVVIDLDGYRLKIRQNDQDPSTFVTPPAGSPNRSIFVMGPDSDPSTVIKNIQNLSVFEPNRFDNEIEGKLKFKTQIGSNYPRREALSINHAIWAGRFSHVALPHQLAVNACTIPCGRDGGPFQMLSAVNGKFSIYAAFRPNVC